MSRYLVAGPPCAGKSTYVSEHAGPDALIVCWDTIAVELGSPRKHDHPFTMRHRIAAEYDRRLGQVDDAKEAWIIRTLADPLERQTWADELDAELILLVPPIAELLRRARRRPNPEKTARDIRRWLAAQ